MNSLNVVVIGAESVLTYEVPSKVNVVVRRFPLPSANVKLTECEMRASAPTPVLNVAPNFVGVVAFVMPPAPAPPGRVE